MLWRQFCRPITELGVLNQAMWELLLQPEATVGAVVGIVLAAGLHWLFPEHDLALVQAGLVAGGFLVGLVVATAKSGNNGKGHR